MSDYAKGPKKLVSKTKISFDSITTVSKATDAYSIAVAVESEDQEAVLTIWKELSLREANQARFYDEDVDAFCYAPPKSEARKVALKKMSEHISTEFAACVKAVDDYWRI